MGRHAGKCPFLVGRLEQLWILMQRERGPLELIPYRHQGTTVIIMTKYIGKNILRHMKRKRDNNQGKRLSIEAIDVITIVKKYLKI